MRNASDGLPVAIDQWSMLNYYSSNASKKIAIHHSGAKQALRGVINIRQPADKPTLGGAVNV
jgi:hypothetical protein